MLRDEPIEARPPSTLYHLRKFARRNTGLVVGLGVAVVVLIGGSAGMTVFALRARDSERKASALAP